MTATNKRLDRPAGTDDTGDAEPVAVSASPTSPRQYKIGVLAHLGMRPGLRRAGRIVTASAHLKARGSLVAVGRRRAQPGSHEWRREHGLADEVYEARGYIRYHKHGLDLVRTEYADAGAADNQITWAENRAAEGSGSGLLMRGHGIPGVEAAGFSPVLPQIRPDKPGAKRRPAHYHPWERPEGYVPRQPDPETGKPTGKALRRSRCSDGWAKRRHILGTRLDHPEAHDIAAQHGFDTPELIAKLLADADRDDPDARIALEEILREAAPFYGAEHFHWRARKYLLPIKRTKPWVHDHETAYAGKPHRLRQHLRRHHNGVDVVGEHRHHDVPDDDPLVAPGRRLDINPLAWKLLPEAELVFFVIEGKIKADAVLSAIRATDLQASVFDVPAVGQWDAPELPWFTETHLHGKSVVIVPDADWHFKEAVNMQALLCRSALEDLGLRACVAAPPSDRLAEDIKGVDDYLGKGGGNLLDMQVVGLEVPERAFAAWKQRYARMRVNGRRMDVRRLRRDARTLHGLILLAGPLGQMRRPPIGSLARFTDQSEDIVGRALGSLLEAEEPPISVEGSLEVSPWRYLGKDRHVQGWSWNERDEWPLITIIDPSLRAVQPRPRRLRQWLTDIADSL